MFPYLQMFFHGDISLDNNEWNRILNSLQQAEKAMKELYEAQEKAKK